jgi:fructuronate reductase
MDGSQKLPQRLFAPALDRLAAGRTTRRIALGVAAWLRFLKGRSDAGEALRIDDPLAGRLSAAAGAATDSPALADAVFAMRDIVPPELAGAQAFRGDVVAALDQLAAHGARMTLQRWSD